MPQPTTKIGMTLTDFIEASAEQKFELINGEMRPKMPGIAGHNYVIHLIYEILTRFLIKHELGKAFMEATFFCQTSTIPIG